MNSDPDKAINGCTNLIRTAPNILAFTSAETLGSSNLSTPGPGGGGTSSTINPVGMTANIANNATVADATITRALAYVKKSRFDDAIRDCTLVLSFLPNNANCYGIRAAAFIGKNLDDNALVDAEKGVALDPGNAGVLTTRAQVYEKIGARDKAIADYRKALQLDPNLSAPKLALVRLGIN